MDIQYYDSATIYINLNQDQLNLMENYFEGQEILESLDFQLTKGFYFEVKFDFAKYLNIGDKIHIRNLYHTPKWLIEKGDGFDEVMFSSYFLNSTITITERFFSETLMLQSNLTLGMAQEDYHPNS